MLNGDHWFIAGTDTDVGKTYVTAALLRWLAARGNTCVGYKPVCSGGRQDALLLQDASQPEPVLDEINPYWYKASLAPYAAALIENRPVALASLVGAFAALTQRYEHVLVEGAGGWETPLAGGG
jgi:dethiobiotin synthetase